eukprot:scaffold134071_cov20-Tisochrysis_lutea.AAC.1
MQLRGGGTEDGVRGVPAYLGASCSFAARALSNPGPGPGLYSPWRASRDANSFSTAPVTIAHCTCSSALTVTRTRARSLALHPRVPTCSTCMPALRQPQDICTCMLMRVFAHAH